MAVGFSRYQSSQDPAVLAHTSSRCRSTMCIALPFPCVSSCLSLGAFAFRFGDNYLPQRFTTALVTASRTASCRIAHWK
jgi:hypothetical protein